MDESERIISASEIIKDRLYFVTFKASFSPKSTVNTHYFCTDDTFVYENFYWDFGPLNICNVYNYCELLNAKLSAKTSGRRKVIHFTNSTPQKRVNAAFLIGAYSIVELNKSAEESLAILTRGDSPPFMKFRDASNITPLFEISLLDCLCALEKAIKYRFIDFADFNAMEYEFFERVENGDLNWIMPRKFLAMCGPHRVAGIVKGYPQHAPESYFDYFRKHDVKHIIRLNCKSYDAKQFTENGFKHLEMFFPDGSCPNDAIMQQFLQYCEQTNYGIAVHCKAGLGRTGSLIGAYLVKHYLFSALEAIAWLRLCRPGSVIGHQQRWLEEKQEQLWLEGRKYRKKQKMGEPQPLQYGIYSNFVRLVAVRDKMGSISNQVLNINLNDETTTTTTMAGDDNYQDVMNNNACDNSNDSGTGAINEDSANNNIINNNNNNSKAMRTRGRHSPTNDNYPKGPPKAVTQRTKGAPLTGGSGGGGTGTGHSTKTQGDELNEIKATRRRRTRSQNIERSNNLIANSNNNNNSGNGNDPPQSSMVIQRFVAKIHLPKSREVPVSQATGNGGSGGTYSRRTRLMKMLSAGSSGSDKNAGAQPTIAPSNSSFQPATAASAAASTTVAITTSTSSSSPSPSSTVLARNLRNAAAHQDSVNNNNNNNSSTSQQVIGNKRNKRSIHERENTAAASKISRRYASTTMAVQQKQKEPVHHHHHHHNQGTTTLIVKKVTITPVAATTNATATHSKTYPGPKRTTF